jgi:hypothetical protein
MGGGTIEAKTKPLQYVKMKEPLPVVHQKNAVKIA